MKNILIIGLVLGLTGCSSLPTKKNFWVNNSIPKEQLRQTFLQNTTACTAMAFQSFPVLRGTAGWVMVGNRNEMYSQCMEGKGWFIEEREVNS